nr:MAG TPA: hypothetical protein [Caudoviricetes sp.]
MRTTERYSWHNENPYNRNVGDCTVRAISTALDQDWDTTYIGLCLEGYLLKDMPSSNEVWRSYLSRYGLERRMAPPHTTVNEFARTHRSDVYLLGLNSHVVCIIDGTILDTWDSGEKEVLYYWKG